MKEPDSMMMRRNGIAAFGLGVIVFGVGVVALTLWTALGSLGMGIGNFITTFLFDNLLFWIVIAVLAGVIFVAKRNAGQKNPKWKQDLAGLGGGLLLVLFLVLVVPAGSGLITGFTADVTVTVDNDPLSPAQVSNIEVGNFEKAGPLSIIGEQSGFSQVFGIFSDTVDGTAVVTCDGEQITKKSFTLNVIETQAGKETFTVRDLPAGASCEVTAAVKGGDGLTRSFTVPSA